MRPLLHPCLLNGRKGDPALYIETLFEKHAVLFDLGDLSNLPPRKIQRFENAIIRLCNFRCLLRPPQSF